MERWGGFLPFLEKGVIIPIVGDGPDSALGVGLKNGFVPFEAIGSPHAEPMEKQMA